MIDIIENNLDKIDNIIPFIKKFNGKDYTMGFTIFNIDSQYNIFLREPAIKRFEINNNIDSYYPTCKLIFEDQGGEYTANMNSIGEFLHVYIRPPCTTKEDKLSNGKEALLNLYFMIDKHTLKEFQQKTLTYEIECSLYIKRNFSAHVNYANDKSKGMLSPYLIIKHILNSVNCFIKKDIPPCTKTINFISDQNNTVKDHVNYCLWLGASEENPPAFLYYNLLENELILFNRNTLPPDSKYACNTALVIPNPNGNKYVNNSLIMYNIKTYSALDFETFLKSASLEHRWTYNTETREWTREFFKPQKYQDLLSITKDKNKEIKSIFQIEEFEQSDIRYYSTNFEYNVYKRLHNLEVGTYCMSFMVEGNLLRDCAQVICVNANDPNYANKFGGIWQNYSVSHIFEAENYSNVINCYRTFNYAIRKETQ